MSARGGGLGGVTLADDPAEGVVADDGDVVGAEFVCEFMVRGRELGVSGGRTGGTYLGLFCVGGVVRVCPGWGDHPGGGGRGSGCCVSGELDAALDTHSL